MKKKLEKTSITITRLRNLAILFNGIALILIGTLFFFPHILPPILKIYLIAVSGCISVIIIVALAISRKDSTTTLFFTLFLAHISGIFFGISITAIAING